MSLSLPLILIVSAIFGICLGVVLYERFIGRMLRFHVRQRMRRLFSDSESFHLPSPVNSHKISTWVTIGMALSPSSLKELAKTRRKLQLAGFRKEEHIGNYYTLKYCGACLGVFLGIYLWHIKDISPTGIVIVAALLTFAPDIALKLITRNRLQKVTLALPDFIDLCNVSMTAGLSWLSSVKRVLHELSSIHPEICREFSHLFDQIQTGMDRIEAFENLAIRNPTTEMQYLVNVLVQNERMGSSILTSLTDFSSRIYRMREQIMEEKAGKLSAKMAIVILPFLLLPYMLILVSEQIVQLMRMLST